MSARPAGMAETGPRMLDHLRALTAELAESFVAQRQVGSALLKTVAMDDQYEVVLVEMKAAGRSDALRQSRRGYFLPIQGVWSMARADNGGEQPVRGAVELPRNVPFWVVSSGDATALMIIT